MILQTLVIYHVLQDLLCWFEVVPRPVKRLFAHRLCRFVVEAFKVRVGQTLLDVKSFKRTKMKHFPKQIKSDRVTFRE